MAFALGPLMWGSGLLTAGSIASGVCAFLCLRDEAASSTQKALFKLDGVQGGVAGSWPQNGLHVNASPLKDNATAVFSHADWAGQGVTGRLEGYAGRNEAREGYPPWAMVPVGPLQPTEPGVIGGNFSIPSQNGGVGNEKRTEPITGQWITVDETAAPEKFTAFNMLVDMLAAEKQEGSESMSLEGLLNQVMEADKAAKQ